jgi:hypothetical protein
MQMQIPSRALLKNMSNKCQSNMSIKFITNQFITNQLHPFFLLYWILVAQSHVRIESIIEQTSQNLS